MKHPIQIRTLPMYLPEQSDPDEDRYVFSYAIEITNQGDKPVQLLSRFWLITHGSGREEQVSGDGVVGQQPVIQPGANHRYSSGAILDSPVGTMEGYYELRTDDGELFRAPIDRFRLSMPGIIN